MFTAEPTKLQNISLHLWNRVTSIIGVHIKLVWVLPRSRVYWTLQYLIGCSQIPLVKLMASQGTINRHEHEKKFCKEWVRQMGNNREKEDGGEWESLVYIIYVCEIQRTNLILKILIKLAWRKYYRLKRALQQPRECYLMRT